MNASPQVDFVHDVAPVLSRLGCNAGTCHGSAQGKNGFKLSLRGYDPLFDVRALTDDHASRRVNLASPDDSLMLLKPTGAVPHVGGALMQPGRALLRDAPRLDRRRREARPDRARRSTKIEVVAGQPGRPADRRSKQQLRVLATYSSGEVRDVTREAFLESGNTEVATAGTSGPDDRRSAAARRPILARFEGAYAATTLTVMGDRTGLRLGAAARLQQDRRARRRQVAADEDPARRASAPTPSSSAASTST